MFPIVRLTIFLTLYKKTHLINRSFHTSSDAYIKCIENYARNRSLMAGKVLHAHLVINGLASLSHVASKLITMYVKCGDLCIAHQVFDEMPKSSYRRWVVLIGAYSKGGFYRQALNILWRMQAEGVKPNNFVLPSALKACGHLFELQAGQQMHGFILRSSYKCDVYVSCALIDMYSKCGFVEKAKKVYDDMIEKDLVALNAMVAGYVHAGLVKEALSLVEKVHLMGLKPDVITWNTLISGFSQAGDSLMVDELFQVMRVNKIEPDVVSWTSIISGFVKNFQSNEAFVMFRKMLMDSGCLPNANTISSLLSACANVANMKQGREIHGFALVVGLEKDVYVQSALIDMYGKCGCIMQASTLFRKMNRKNTPTWNSMIFGYANHGYCNEAIELFKKMEIQEVEKLDHLTFTAVLTACSHSGMVELGKTLFESMQKKYNIKPRVEHYACMVDLFGRAGKLTEAYGLIKMMPVQPDQFVWGALLGACRQHGNIELAEEAAKHLSELEPQGAVTGLLSNLYAEAGSWRNAARLKKLMKKKKSNSTFLGRSWIEAS